MKAILPHNFNRYLYYFETIEYAVYHTEMEIANYEAFSRVIKK